MLVMPSTTNTDRLIGVEKELARLDATFNGGLTAATHEINWLGDELKLAHSKLEVAVQRIATLEQRCVHLENQSNRQWQVWLAVAGAFVSLLVAFVKR
jgi:hypothetical protein